MRAMTRLLRRLSLTLAAFAAATGAADEGQWLPQQVLAMDWDALRARGMRLSRDEFWNPERGGVLSAAVQIGGCSASFCSSDGLVVTNHHCGFGAINSLSTPARNFLRDGFVAATRSDELPAPGMVVSVVRRIEDVTAAIKAAQAEARSDLERYQLTEEAKQRLVTEGEREPDTTCHVADFYEGREYHLYYRTRLTDVRLVYAPPRAIGEFGGEVDNWEWPRHTGDFTFFRAYVGPDGSPAGYSADNVPYRPAHWLRVSRDGVQEGDLAMILGYPGQTERYLTATAVQDRQGYFYPKRLELLTAILDVLHKASARDDQSELRYASLIKQLSNVQKNAAGMVWGLERNAVVARKQREEEQFRAWLAASPERTARYGSVLDSLVDLDLDERTMQEQELLLGLVLSPRIDPLLATLVAMVGSAGAVRDGKVPPGLAERIGNPDVTRDFAAVQRPILEILLGELRLLPEAQRMPGSEVLSPDLDVDTANVVDALLAQTRMTDAGARLELLAGGEAAIAASEDPLVVLARGLHAAAEARTARAQQREGRRIALGTSWIEAQQAWRGTAFYPDANSTLRVSIATVKGYEPRDGVRYVPHTTVAGILRKETGKEPFASPQALLSAAERRRESRFFDWRIGDVPVCFLTDGDTTGGNSGSPVINGRGELVGLNFDRVFENVSGDFGWSAARSRNISVDIRYVLWILEQVQPAPHLLAEMGVG
jgi:hypothetical protein